jgi:uncharacterized protein (TIGR03032 family)
MGDSDPADVWDRHSAQWRDPAQIVSHWERAGQVDPALLERKVRGRFWEALDDAGVTLLVSREYEHLLTALSVRNSRPYVTFMSLPHPSGIAVDRSSGSVFVASTRNPNQVYEFAAAAGALERLDAPSTQRDERPLVPVRSTFFPGSLYMHDLAFIQGRLHANAVGHNAVIEIDNDAGRWERTWWPRAIERDGAPEFRLNFLQLNSIAAGASLQQSFFSASTDRLSARRPGHLNFPVDRRGVIFSGRTREPLIRGLTRPHSARLHRELLWVANSGYGELSYAEGETATTFAKLPGWTRGLCLREGVAFVGTSRVIPRFRAYAPGLEVERSICGVHAVDIASGKTIGSISWPGGNQIFAVEWIGRDVTLGLPFGRSSRLSAESAKLLFYSFETDEIETGRNRQ